MEQSDNIAPEVRLLMAMLRVAIMDLTDKDQEVKSDAEDWFMYTGPAVWGSFDFVCSFVGMSADTILESLVSRGLLPRAAVE
jgi:hypothetical protein